MYHAVHAMECMCSDDVSSSDFCNTSAPTLLYTPVCAAIGRGATAAANTPHMGNNKYNSKSLPRCTRTATSCYQQWNADIIGIHRHAPPHKSHGNMRYSGMHMHQHYPIPIIYPKTPVHAGRLQRMPMHPRASGPDILQGNASECWWVAHDLGA